MKNSSITNWIKSKSFIAFTFLLLFFIFSCKKNTEPAYNNEIKATVVIAPGDTIKINATGANAKMGCSAYAGITYVNAETTDHHAVYLNIFDPLAHCITSPGTYTVSCEYRKDLGTNTFIYSDNSGRITFTVIDEHNMEGVFTAVCKCNSPGCTFSQDSVIVTGTFKGDHLDN